MTHDRRGFHYALEAVRSLTEWEINDVALLLAEQNASTDAQQKRVDGLSHSLAAVRADVIAQRQNQALLNIDAQRRAHAYMEQVQQQLIKESAHLRAILQERDKTFARLNESRKFADNLDADKESAAQEHDKKIANQTYLQADDGWLQRLHWRKSS
jgi:hypothetical protein